MNTPDKCPHCGADEYPDSSPRFHTRSAGKLPWLCGTLRDTVNPVRTGRCFENELINERAAHAETKRSLQMEMQSFEAILKQLDAMHIRAERAETELTTTKRELAQASAECGIAHDQRRDEAHRAEKAEARVRDLEAMRHAALELAQYASYAEIVGRVLLNREQIREWSEKVFKLNLDLGEAMGGSK